MSATPVRNAKLWSKHDLVLQHLQAGHEISGRDAFRLFQLYRLSSVIYRLRRRGYNVITEQRTDPATGDTFAVYRLMPNENS